MHNDMRDGIFDGAYDIREEWEEGMTPVVVVEDEEELTIKVALRTKGGKYYCHRYFTIGDDWNVSVDKSGTDAERVLRWFEEK